MILPKVVLILLLTSLIITSDIRKAYAASAWTSCAGCGVNESGGGEVDCSCACVTKWGCVDPGAYAFCEKDQVGCPIGIGVDCNNCAQNHPGDDGGGGGGGGSSLCKCIGCPSDRVEQPDDNHDGEWCSDPCGGRGKVDCQNTGGCGWDCPTPSPSPCNPIDWSAWSPVCTSQNCSGNIDQTRTSNCNIREMKKCSCTITYTPTPPVTITTAPSTTPAPTLTLSPAPTISTPTPTPITGAPISWFKTRFGNVHSNKDILASMPSLLERFATYLVTTNGLSSFALGSEYDSRPDLASEKNWFWYSPPYGEIAYPEMQGFFEYYRRIKMPSETISVNQINNAFLNGNTGSGINIPIIAIDPTGGGLSTTEDLMLTGDKQLVFYINGDLNINHNIYLRDNSGVIFVVKGNLNISNTPIETDGVYFVDQTVNTADSDSNIPLVIKGAVYTSVNGRIFGRSRKSQNVLVPSELVIFEPKYLVKFAGVFGKSVYMWKEVAP